VRAWPAHIHLHGKQRHHADDLFITHSRERDRMPRLVAVGQHQRWRTPHPIPLLTQVRLGERGFSRATTIELSSHSFDIESYCLNE
jgi:hypothetical protein